MLAIDHTQNNGVAEVHVGDSFQVHLAENPTTGYGWRLTSAGDPALRIVGDSFAASQSAYGAGGTRHWTFMADRPAVVPLCFELKRSWQPQAVETFKVTVSVKAR